MHWFTPTEHFVSLSGSDSLVDGCVALMGQITRGVQDNG